MRQPHQAHSAALKRQMDELVDLEGDDSEVAKARLRVIKNRLAAQKSRETARHYVQNLEHSLSLLGTESQLLAARLAKVEQENAQLRAAQTIPGRPQGAARPEPPARRPSSGGGRRQETTETEGTSREPAALSPSSLQLDALLLLVSVAARLLPPSALRRPGDVPWGNPPDEALHQRLHFLAAVAGGSGGWAHPPTPPWPAAPHAPWPGPHHCASTTRGASTADGRSSADSTRWHFGGARSGIREALPTPDGLRGCGVAGGRSKAGDVGAPGLEPPRAAPGMTPGHFGRSCAEDGRSCAEDGRREPRWGEACSMMQLLPRGWESQRDPPSSSSYDPTSLTHPSSSEGGWERGTSERQRDPSSSSSYDPTIPTHPSASSYDDATTLTHPSDADADADDGAAARPSGEKEPLMYDSTPHDAPGGGAFSHQAGGVSLSHTHTLSPASLSLSHTHTLSPASLSLSHTLSGRTLPRATLPRATSPRATSAVDAWAASCLGDILGSFEGSPRNSPPEGDVLAFLEANCLGNLQQASGNSPDDFLDVGSAPPAKKARTAPGASPTALPPPCGYASREGGGDAPLLEGGGSDADEGEGVDSLMGELRGNELGQFDEDLTLISEMVW